MIATTMMTTRTTRPTMRSGVMFNKCNQCDNASLRAGDLKTHLKTHSGEKSNKCNYCDFAYSYVNALMVHFKTHSGEKSNKCNQLFSMTQYGAAMTLSFGGERLKGGFRRT